MKLFVSSEHSLMLTANPEFRLLPCHIAMACHFCRRPVAYYVTQASNVPAPQPQVATHHAPCANFHSRPHAAVSDVCFLWTSICAASRTCMSRSESKNQTLQII